MFPRFAGGVCGSILDMCDCRSIDGSITEKRR
jgi:hypothetical protein